MAELGPNATLDDIVFANRNKAYGAFTLRRGYRADVTKATLIGAALFLMAMFAPTIISKFATDDKEELVEVEVDLMKMPPPPIDPAEPPPPPPPPIEQPKVNTVKFLPPEVKKDEEVPEETPPPTVEEIKEAVVANKTIEGDPNANEIIVAPEAVAAPSKGTVVEAAPEPEKVFTVVEQQPEFPGGTSEMYKYLGKNIKYPSAASRANVSGRVFMSFVVNVDGSIQDVQVLKGLGFGCDEEAIRVVKAMPKWKPGKQSGRAVRVKYNLPINFQLE
ncbi:energy transducer TonB [Dyadobacter sp. CY312]|jgi:protein TonB|uniref:energy transducer TonB n=1 Tax=Dyadobacter sp. CY312 TaxID=2907303 RepID=UPI001F1AF3F7|nr:energy transducer TonB [Dyadobacter sp. CY312]MCE7042260.1 TonB family protein [Dyadobacter sp. CY312]